MDLTPQQASTLATYIESVPELAAAPRNSDGAFAIAAALNANASPAYTVWRDAVSIDELHDAVKWASLTPTDPVPAGDAVALAVWQARSLGCQGKQFNLQMILEKPAGSVNGARLGVRQGLQDALTNVPSGVGGAAVDAGWLGATGVRLALQRPASVLERLLATGAGTQASPGAMAISGPIDGDTVQAARGD